MEQSTTKWKKSSFCSDNACVEVAFYADGVAVRDSKNVEQQALQFTHREWNAFVQGVKADEFLPF